MWVLFKDWLSKSSCLHTALRTPDNCGLPNAFFQVQAAKPFCLGHRFNRNPNAETTRVAEFTTKQRSRAPVWTLKTTFRLLKEHGFLFCFGTRWG